MIDLASHIRAFFEILGVCKSIPRKPSATLELLINEYVATS